MLKNAIEQYQKITQQDPKDAESFSMLARLYRVSHDDAAAENAYRQVLKLDANDEDALNGLAMVFADRGDLPNAIELLKQVVEKNPDPRTVVMLAQFYEQVKDYSNAADTLKQALAVSNDDIRLRRQWAIDLYAAGRLDEALGAFQELADRRSEERAAAASDCRIAGAEARFRGRRRRLWPRRGQSENSTEVRYAEVELVAAAGEDARRRSPLCRLS